MTTHVLNEGVLNDDLLLLADEGKVFKGGFIAIIKKYSFSTSWSDREEIKKFRQEKSLFNYITRNYPNSDINI